MGNTYSQLNELILNSNTCITSSSKYNEYKNDLYTLNLNEEIKKLEENIKKLDDVLNTLSNKCDKVITRIVSLENKTYELIETIKFNPDVGNWDYYDFKQNGV